MTSSLRRRLRFEAFLPRLWEVIAWRILTLPLPVSLKRFFEPLWVFCLGIAARECSEGSPGGPEHEPHDRVPCRARLVASAADQPDPRRRSEAPQRLPPRVRDRNR